MKSVNDNIYRILGIVGLTVLLIFILWAQYKSRPDKHDHSDPTQHGHTIHATQLKDSQDLVPSGTVEGNVRIVNYDAFRYYFSPDPLVIYAGETVELRVKSNDSKHGVMIPEIDFSAEMPLEQRKSVSFKAPNKPGEYPVFCSVYCGPGHGDMIGKLIVLPLPEGKTKLENTGDQDNGHSH